MECFLLNYLLYVDKQISREYNRSFKKIPKLICAFEKNFEQLLKYVASDTNKNNLQKVKQLISEIKKYQSSGEFKKKLFEAVNKDSNISVEEKYNSIK